MKKQVIAVDFDDVLMNFNEGFIEFHNRDQGTNIRYEDVTSYDMEMIYGCVTHELVDRIYRFCHSSHHEEVKPIPGAVKACQYLRDFYVLEIVTSRAETLRSQTNVWLNRHFPDTFRNVHFTNGFGAAPGALQRTKSDVCLAINAKALVDDAPKHAEEVVKRGIPVLLPDRPWNRASTPKGVIRVSSWYEVTSWVVNNV